MTDTIEQLVYLAIGEASMCWSNIDGAGIFDSHRAATIGHKLSDDIHKLILSQKKCTCKTKKESHK